MLETNVLYYFITFQWFVRNLYMTRGCLFLPLSLSTPVLPPSFCWFCIHEFMTIYISGTVPITIQCEERKKENETKSWSTLEYVYHVKICEGTDHGQSGQNAYDATISKLK